MPQRPASARALLGTILTVLGVLLLAGVLEISVIGSLRHARAQTVSYGVLRGQLATSTAPVGPRAADGQLLALGSPVALLEIPRLHLRQVVGEGTTSGVLMNGPGHVRSSVLPGQPGISQIYGRRAGYGGPFARLASLRPGDTIVVITGQGRQTYRVTDLRRQGDRYRALAAGRGRLVLTTASGSAYVPNGVLYVDADLVSVVQPAPAQLTGALPSELPMAGDPSAIVPVVLWAQGLLLAAVGIVYLRARWGRWQTWVVAVPVTLYVGVSLAAAAARLLPNLL